MEKLIPMKNHRKASTVHKVPFFCQSKAADNRAKKEIGTVSFFGKKDQRGKCGDVDGMGD